MNDTVNDNNEQALQAIWAATVDIYDGFLAGDRVLTDGVWRAVHNHEDVRAVPR